MNMMNEPQTSYKEWNEERLRDLFVQCADVHIQKYHYGEGFYGELILLYAGGLSDISLISKAVLPGIEELYNLTKFSGVEAIESGKMLPIILIKQPSQESIMEAIFDGNLILFFPGATALFKMDISAHPKRTPAESSMEISIKGPKDGFVEDLVTNVALIRRRIRTNSLCYETYTIGTRTKTNIGLMYMKDIISPQVLEEARTRLSKINIDGIVGVNEVEEMLADKSNTIFPLLDSTGRPDYVVNCLLVGRFALIIDGNPVVLIAPATFSLVLKSPEDVHFNFIYITFARITRLVSLILCLFLPGFWIALTAFHQDQIPYTLLSTVGVSRAGIPLSTQVELLIMLLLLDIFREAGIRLPSHIGQTLTVVGGLIIGEAAIRAGMVSPSMVVVGAITAVAGATLVNQTLSTTVSVLRFVIFLCCAILGMFGFMLSLFLLITYLARLESFGVPYLSPIAPIRFKEAIIALFRIPRKRMGDRPQSLHPIDSDAQEEKTS
jgi:spore germination protein KA